MQKIILKSSNFIIKIVLIGSIFVIESGCSSQHPKGLWITESPKSEPELGLMVSQASQSEIDQLVQQKKISARLISAENQIYEIYGVEKEEAHLLLPHAETSENSFFTFSDSDFAPHEANYYNSENYQNHLKIIEAEEAWSLANTKGREQVVGVIDLGVNIGHKDFSGRIYANEVEKINNIDDDENGLIDDIHGWNFASNNNNIIDSAGHGTSVASLISSEIIGVAPEAKLFPLKVVNEMNKIDEATVIAALNFIQNKTPIKILNLSFGKKNVSKLFLKTLSELEKKGVLIIASAGNRGLQCGAISNYPASSNALSNIISVGASLLHLEPPFALASYSNYGPCIDVVAPAGESKLSIATPFLSAGNTSHYILFNGTSAATPIVSGVAALLKSLKPDLTASQIKEILLKSSQQTLNQNNLSKYGMVNAKRAVEEVLRMRNTSEIENN